MLGAHHFSEFERELGIGPGVLSDRLSRLVEVEVMVTAAATTRTDAHAYRLTPKGIAFFPALAFIAEWSREFEVEGQKPELTLDHAVCGQRLRPVLLCEHCGKPLERDRVGFSELPASLRATQHT
jgi:DNA-binding HxlR family transcriptional regulator